MNQFACEKEARPSLSKYMMDFSFQEIVFLVQYLAICGRGQNDMSGIYIRQIQGLEAVNNVGKQTPLLSPRESESVLFLFSVSESSSSSLVTFVIALLSTLFLVTMARTKGSRQENLVQDNMQKPSLGEVNVVTQQSETAESYKEQAEAQSQHESSFPLDCERSNIMDRCFEHNAHMYDQQVVPHSDTLLPSDSESFEIDHNKDQNMDISESLMFDSDDEKEDGLIEIKLPSNHFYGLTEDSYQRFETNFLPRSIFNQQGLTELLAEINDDENLIEIDISMGSTNYQDFRLKKELACLGDQCVLSD
ncbi:hypothetical protein RJT34_12308 [Clitoria ternatea]|uniref:Uncharacterized protein n=1 Tax=Clitoria ternatea TaxID=43366 RepID=A0AAN9PKT6_CLITE